MQHVQKDGIEFSDVTLACEDDNDNSDVIECAQEMVGTEFFDVTIAITIMKIQFLLSLDKELLW